MHIIMLTAQYCIDYLILCASVDFLIALDLNQRFLLHKNRFVSVKVFSIGHHARAEGHVHRESSSKDRIYVHCSYVCLYHEPL